MLYDYIHSVYVCVYIYIYTQHKAAVGTSSRNVAYSMIDCYSRVFASGGYSVLSYRTISEGLQSARLIPISWRQARYAPGSPDGFYLGVARERFITGSSDPTKTHLRIDRWHSWQTLSSTALIRAALRDVELSSAPEGRPRKRFWSRCTAITGVSVCVCTCVYIYIYIYYIIVYYIIFYYIIIYIYIYIVWTYSMLWADGCGY